MVYSNTAFYKENGCGKSGHMSIFTSSKHLMTFLKFQFSRASFLHLIKDTGSMWSCSSDFFLEVETLLNNVSNYCDKNN